MANEINTGKFMVIVTSLIVGVILIVGVLVPIIGNSTDSGSSSDSEETYTNTGDWYYNKATSRSSTTISLGTSLDAMMNVTYITMTVDDGEPITTEFPMWTSETAADISAIPLFIYKMNNGKYGVEGLVSGYGGTDYADITNFGDLAGTMYYRFTQGDAAPTVYDIFTGEGATVTLANGHVTVSVGDDTVVPAINGSYVLYFTGDASGDYVFGRNMTVLDSTEFYICGSCGSAMSDTDPITSDPIITYGQDTISCIGKGTLSTIEQSSNLTMYVKDASSPVTPELTTTDASEGDGKVLSYLQVGDYGSMTDCFLVPTTVGGESGSGGMDPTLAAMVSVIPLVMIIGMIIMVVGYFIVKK